MYRCLKINFKGEVDNVSVKLQQLNQIGYIKIEEKLKLVYPEYNNRARMNDNRNKHVL